MIFWPEFFDFLTAKIGFFSMSFFTQFYKNLKNI
jgi:hypothetical protein